MKKNDELTEQRTKRIAGKDVKKLEFLAALDHAIRDTDVLSAEEKTALKNALVSCTSDLMPLERIMGAAETVLKNIGGGTAFIESYREEYERQKLMHTVD